MLIILFSLLPVSWNFREWTHFASGAHGHVRLPTLREEDYQQSANNV